MSLSLYLHFIKCIFFKYCQNHHLRNVFLFFIYPSKSPNFVLISIFVLIYHSLYALPIFIIAHRSSVVFFFVPLLLNRFIIRFHSMSSLCLFVSDLTNVCVCVIAPKCGFCCFRLKCTFSFVWCMYICYISILYSTKMCERMKFRSVDCRKYVSLLCGINHNVSSTISALNRE